MEVIGTVSGLITVIAGVTAVAKRLNEVRDKYNNFALHTTLVASQLSTIRAALQAIAEWRSTDQTSSRPSRQLDDDLAVSLNCCAVLITVVDSKLGEAGYTPGMKQKIKHLWLEDTLKEYISNLEGQVRALQLLLTIFQCRTVTEQRQKLELEESRIIIENVRAETASLRFENGNFQDAPSILSMDPSVNFDVDSILLRSPAYVRVYGNRRPRVPELPSQTSPLPELHPHPIPLSELTTQIVSQQQLPSQSPQLPPRLVSGRLDMWNNFSVENQEQHRADLRIPSSAQGVELPAENIVPSTGLETRTPEVARPVELATTRDSNDLGVAAARYSILASETDITQDSPTGISQSGVVSRPGKAAASPTSIQKTARPQSTHSDLYDSSIKGVGSGVEPRLQSTSSACDAEPSKVIAPIGSKGRQLGDSIPKPLMVKSIARPPSTDSELYNGSIQAPIVDETPQLVEPDRNANPTDLRNLSGEEPSESFSASLELESSKVISDSRAITKDEDVVIEDIIDKSNSYDSKSGPTSSDIPGDVTKSSITELSTSLASDGKIPKESPVPIFKIYSDPSRSHFEESSFSSIPPFNNNEEDFQILGRQIDDQLMELHKIPRGNGTPASLTRPPPSVPAPPPLVTLHADRAGLQPEQSVDSTASGLRITGIPSRPLQDHTSSLYSGMDSEIPSNSQQDHQILRSSPTTIPSDTIDTVISTDSQGSLQGQAQAELRHLQLQLAEAKRRGDTHTAKAPLQRSIELIQRTCLPESSIKEPPANIETVNKLGFKGKSLMRLPSFSHLTNAKVSALIEAASVGDLLRLRSLLEDKVNVNVRGDNYRTPQMAAAIHGHLDCLKLLRNYAADEFATDGQGRTVMHFAVMTNRLETVNWLLGAYPPSSAQIPKSWRLFRAAYAVKEMISHKILREVPDAEGLKPLHMAAILNLEAMVELLLAAGAQIDCRNNWSRTPLHEAVILNLPGIAQTLITSGAKVEAVDAELMSPLHLAVKHNHKESIALLLENNANRYAYDANGDLPIHVAARQGNISAMENLVTNRTDLGRTTKHGETLVHMACLTNELTMADYLVQNAVDVNPWARPQQTQFGSAVSVLSSSLNIKRATDLPRTPLHYSCMTGLYEMSALLLDHGAWVNATPDDGMTPLMMAVESENTNLVCLLLARGAKVNATMPGSCLTAMHMSARRGDLETTQVLIRDGASMLARTSDSRTPWEYSVFKLKDAEKRKAIDEYFRRINGGSYIQLQN